MTATTKAMLLKITQKKEPVAKKTNKVKKAPQAPKIKKATSIKSYGITAFTPKIVDLKDSKEHQHFDSVAVKLPSSIPRSAPSAEHSVDNAIEILTPTETKAAYSRSSAASESGVDMSHSTDTADVLHIASTSIDFDGPIHNRPTQAKGNKVPTSKAGSVQRAGTTSIAIAENIVEQIPRISAKLTLAMLKEEAVCRGLVLRQLPRTKAEILSLLSDGSIHLTGTSAWKEVEVLKAKMREEQQELENTRREKQQEVEDKRREKELEELALKHNMEREQQDRATKRREEEIKSQSVLHVHDYHRIHSHPLAKTMDLTLNGQQRGACCELCYGSHRIEWTCEACDFDICRVCFDEKNMTEEERERERQEHARRILEERQEHERSMKHFQEQREAEKRKRQEERETEEELMRDRVSDLFDKAIICPSEKNEDSNGSKQNGFTVWCSFGSDWDGPPAKEFDSTWKTSADANQRARYLFFWKNAFEMEADDVVPDKESAINGLVFYSLQPECEDQCWSVGVVPDVAFLHLPDAISCRHTYDREPDYSYLMGY